MCACKQRFDSYSNRRPPGLGRSRSQAVTAAAASARNLFHSISHWNTGGQVLLFVGVVSSVAPGMCYAVWGRTIWARDIMSVVVAVRRSPEVKGGSCTSCRILCPLCTHERIDIEKKKTIHNRKKCRSKLRNITNKITYSISTSVWVFSQYDWREITLNYVVFQAKYCFILQLWVNWSVRAKKPQKLCANYNYEQLYYYCLE